MGLTGDFEGTSRNVGRYKPKIYKRRDCTNFGPVQSSDVYNCRTGTNVGQYKRQTSTYARPGQTSD